MGKGSSPRRLIEWTGERCVPWTDDIQVIYEHYHRYAYALGFAEGARVLDLGSGEGYGCSVLAAVAGEVVGLDIDEDSVAHAREWYGGDTVRFELGSMTDPGALAGEAPFDVVTCFEAIEHVAEQDKLLALVRNRLAPGGIFLCSTPDVAVYTEEHGNDNPFHVHELDKDEFGKLLGDSFTHVELRRQTVAVGSLIHQDGLAGRFEVQQLRRDSSDSWRVSDGAPHTYFVAVASDRPLDVPGSVMVDPGLTMLADAVSAERARAASQLAEVRATADEARERMRAAEEQTRAEIAELTERCDQAIAEARLARQESAAAAEELAQLRAKAAHDAARLAWLAAERARVSATTAELAAANAELRAEQSPSVQRLITGYRSRVERLAPRGTRRRDVYEKALGRSTDVARASDVPGPVGVTTSDAPIVSVVIPAYSKWQLTRRCLESIQANLPVTPFEVIVVDDASPDDAADRVAQCPGVRLVRSERNRGFVGACNLGAEHARGELLLFLNNDTEVRPGWLDALVGVVETRRDVGLVGAKLIYPDGRLQECGGIVWSDGSGWNYGRDRDAAQPEYQTLRDVDYCSGAALLVRRELFERIGGFDGRYAPAYYEDTDLAFAVRAAGYRTVVQPESVIVHHEGGSNGTDVTSGVKRHQELNRAVFAEKWSTALASHFDAASPRALWLASHRTRDGHGGGVVLVADHQVPRADEDSGSVRMSWLLRLLVEHGERVVFFPMNHALPERYTQWLYRIGVTVVADAQRQAAFLVEAGPAITLAILSRPQVAWQLLEPLREHAPGCRVAYDTVDLHFLRLERQAAVAAETGADDEASVLRQRATVLRQLELGLVRACDVTLTVSDVEQRLLTELAPDASVAVLSNVHEVDGRQASPEGRAGVLFVGSFDHIPNRDAARWLCESIMPIVRGKLPDAELHIVGSNPPDDVRGLAGDGVVVHGWVPDLGPLYQRSRVVVAPLRFGAGVKGKVGESLSLGVPVVGTTVAIEGMHLTPGEHVLVGDTAEEIADHLLTLLTDDQLWCRMSELGKAEVTKRFGVESARSSLIDLLESPRGT